MQWFVYRDGAKVSEALTSEDACFEWLLKHAAKDEVYTWLGEATEGVTEILQRGRLRLACLKPDGPGPHPFYLYTLRGGTWYSEVTKFEPVQTRDQFRRFALDWLSHGFYAQPENVRPGPSQTPTRRDIQDRSSTGE